MTREEIVTSYYDELAEAAEYCEEECGYGNGSNFELVAANIHSWYAEQYPEYFE